MSDECNEAPGWLAVDIERIYWQKRPETCYSPRASHLPRSPLQVHKFLTFGPLLLVHAETLDIPIVVLAPSQLVEGIGLADCRIGQYDIFS